MDFTAKKPIRNPRQGANPLSQLFFWWINPLFWKGYRKGLAVDDLYSPLKEDESARLGDLLSKEWRQEEEAAKAKNKPPRLYKALVRCFWSTYFWLVFGLMVDEWVCRVAQPMFLKFLITAISEGEEDWKKYSYAAGVSVATLLHSLLLHPTMFANQHVGMKCRVGVCSLIYRKVLRLSKRAQGETTIGQMVNLLSNDVIRFDTNLMFIPYLLIGPVQMGIFTYFLWEELGPSCLAGIGFVIFLIPIEYWIGKKFTGYRFHIAKKTDERGRIMNEIIVAMRVIKMYAWEKPFASLVNRIRKEEVGVLRKASGLRAIYLSLYISSARLVTYFVFLAYILQDNPLTADKVFFVLTIFNIIRQLMISYFPTAAAAIGELFVSMNRIEGFLLLENQVENEKEGRFKSEGGVTSGEIQMGDVDASWVGDKVNLHKVTVDLKGPLLVMVVGSVGCGKTSLLHTILAELPISEGTCRVKGRVAYSSQEPWIFGGNVRQNILFGREFDAKRYAEIIRVCALEDDFTQLPHGDETIVGERGVALSGGQKARVNLARGLYQQADIYLMDDPLSAVDSKVSRHIFEKAVKEHLSDHLRILCTHQLQYLPQADHVIVLEEGRVLAQGTYDFLVETGVDFVSLMTSNDSVDDVAKKEEEPEGQGEKVKAEGGKKPEGNAEKMAGGSVTWLTYWEYFMSGGSTPYFLFVVFNFASSQLCFTAADYWLSLWTGAEGKRLARIKSLEATSPSTSTPSAFFGDGRQANGSFIGADDSIPYLGEDVYLYVYTGIVAGIFFLTKARALSFFLYCMRISIKVHNKMFESLVRAPIKFLDDNPSGRVMNRFTKDIGSMDELLPYAFFDAVTIFLLMVTMVTLIIIANAWMAIPTAVLLVLLFVVRAYYIHTARDVKRIESVTRSPIFTHVVSSVTGLTTIRSSGIQETLIQQFDGHQDFHSSSWYVFISANRWFGIVLELISVAYLTVVTFSFLLLGDLLDFDSSQVGLAISSALNLTGVFQWGMRQSAETENLMTSVERALEYSKLQPEAPLDSPPKSKPPPDWPKDGAMQFVDFFVAYEEKDVIKGVTFDVRGREKIGIVGRTGAGKSSIINGVFRMTEPRGSLLIDGLKVNDIGLHDLRTKISIIPQDPVLFSGTMRYNLDPFGQHNDPDMWQALAEVELKEVVDDLDMKVTDGGGNFSVGQRQLVCLARAILRKNRIIVMDEATANVDPRTDQFIQQTIRDKFADCTILTIAHRLQSVMDCDRILVLDNGHLKEYDHPFVLLSNPTGILSSMVSHTGAASTAILKQIASETYSKKRGSFSAANLSDIRRSISVAAPVSPLLEDEE